MKKFLLLALMACAFIACEKQLIGKLPNKQTFTTDSITYSYYVTDLDGNLRKTYKQNEKICIHLDIENNTQDTLYLENMGGNCYNSQNQWIAELSCWVHYDDNFYCVVQPNNICRSVYGVPLTVPADIYHLQKPIVRFYNKGYQGEAKNYEIPLTIYFEVK